MKELTVAGTNFRKDVPIEKLSTDISFWLKYEPENEYDVNAIAVHCDLGHLGYVSKIEQEFINGCTDEEGKLPEIKFVKASSEINGKPVRVVWYSVIETETVDKYGWYQNADRYRSKDRKTWYPNITRVLKGVYTQDDKSWDDYYKKQVTFYLKNIDKEIPDYISDAKAFMDYKARIGSTVHKAVEKKKLTTEILKKYRVERDMERIKSLVLAYKGWKKEYGVEVLFHEKTVLYDGIASPCDILCRIDGKLYTVDLKNTATKKIIHEVQATFYAKGFEIEMKEPVIPALLYLGVKNKKLWQFKTNFRNSIETNIEILKAAKVIEKHLWH